MFALRLTAPSAPHPVSAADGPESEVPAGYVRVHLRAMTVNAADFAVIAGHHHDPPPAHVIGSDGAGVTDEGREVIVYPILADPRYDDPMLDPELRMLGQGVDGTFAETVVVPSSNLVDKPAGMAWETAACLGTAWLTAYRMLTTRGRVQPGDTVLVTGTGGGVATALISLARALGAEVWVIGRDPGRRRRAVDELGACAAFAPDDVLPGPVDLACDTVGADAFTRCLRALRPGGRLVTAGSTAGADVHLHLPELFIAGIDLLGSAMGTPVELDSLATLLATQRLTTAIDSTWDLRDGLAALAHARSAQTFGKVVLRPH